MTENYTVIFAIPSLSSLFGPTVTSFVIDRSASLPLTMFTCAAMAALGALLMVVILKKLKQVQKQTLCPASEKEYHKP